MSGRGRWLGSVSGVVAYNPDISPTAKAVYLVLAIAADSDAYCFPSVGTIAESIGKSRATVHSALAELEDHDVLRREPRFSEGRQTSNGYTLLDIQTIRGGRKT